MSASVPSLPLPGSLPVGSRVTPTRRALPSWAPPKAADLVLDPWSAPVGPPVARTVVSPWPAPDPAMRIITMPPPVALTALPDMSRQGLATPPTTPRVSVAAVAAPSAVEPIVSLDSPVPDSLPKVGHIDPVRPATPVDSSTATSGPSAKLIAALAGLAGVATALIALVASAL